MADDKGKEFMAEISESPASETAQRINQILNEQRQQAAGYQNNQHQHFAQEIQCICDLAREQRMTTEQQIQSTLNQASTNLMDSRRLESIFNSAQQLQQAARMGFSNLQANAKQYSQILEQMEKQCHEQQVATDMQVVQAMQQAISAMAQAQSALLQSHSIAKIFDSITRCGDVLAQIEQADTTLPQ
ncbi:hypothetical protein [Thermosediminibacter oceani]|uniref:Exonuclease SbcC n=1 Tax=Thermosediminibacter oceani (strain ATCC BAA-1034 / DSM 16646 / JW/IW-1228P) TaxID=555079 RepID=D9RZ34_THEOJ|nr:hypothetical protein [Thermosediminibacter oceani]ADL08588.1 exonuclease SbcC [Thermosediminibacter oceani DSM 16646]